MSKSGMANRTSALPCSASKERAYLFLSPIVRRQSTFQQKSLPYQSTKELPPMKKYLIVCLLAATLATGAIFTSLLTVSAAPLIDPNAVAIEGVDLDLVNAIAKLNDEQKAALLVLVKGIVEARSSESPEEGAMKTVAAYVAAAETADLEALMMQVSEDFSHYQAGTKSGYRTFLENVKAEGMLEDISGNLEEAKATVEGDRVKVSPVELEGIFGTVTLELELKNEDGTWRIVGLVMSEV